jgi:hypothetical protein
MHIFQATSICTFVSQYRKHFLAALIDMSGEPDYWGTHSQKLARKRERERKKIMDSIN